MHPQEYQNRLVRTAEAAAHVGLGKSTLEKKRLFGDGPEYQKLGKVVVYQIKKLDEWVAGKSRRSTSEITA
jgi:hypothetical protein